MDKQANDTTKDSQSIQIQPPELPSGGGGIKGIGETFSPNAFSGTGSYAIPVPITPARGFEPKLTLAYDSGSGNGLFGMGFSLALPKISRRTEKGIPRYDEHDVFTANGQELVPVIPNDKAIKRNETLADQEWEVHDYLPRIQSDFSKIEHWVAKSSDKNFWKIITVENTIHIYGKDCKARICDEADSHKIFEWLLQSSTDAHGNKITYQYKSEDNNNVPDVSWEKGRACSNKYIECIQYGNYWEGDDEKFAFEVVFDYGEYDLKNNKNPYQPTLPWQYRADAFSSYRSGFEVRTRRLCHNILVYHHFKKELGDPVLVKRMGLTYENSETTALSFLKEVTITGYRRKGPKATDPYDTKQLPPVSFAFSTFAPAPAPEFKPLIIEQGSDVNAFWQPVDLNAEGIAGLLYTDDQSVLYHPPHGEGEFGQTENLKQFPVDRDVLNGQARLTDLEGRGELNLVVDDGTTAGYYTRRNDGAWDNFTAFASYPTMRHAPYMEAVGLGANGKTDLLMADLETLDVYPSAGKKGYPSIKKMKREQDFPLLTASNKKVHTAFAAMVGDGLPHRVRISNGMVEYCPSLGYGRFGKKVVMGNAPDFGPDFDKSRLRLADIDGSGAMDLIYISPEKVAIYLNRSGNSFTDPISIDLPETYTRLDQISFADILGNGTTCLLFTRRGVSSGHYYYNFSGKLDEKYAELKSLKPHLLHVIDNNMGGVTQIQYTSSTQFYLADKKAGRPWITPLPFPVQVVEKTITTDQITKASYTHSYAYHDGHYDRAERAFKGFGLVETWDTESYEEYQHRIDANAVQGHTAFTPPVHTRTWHHTGALMTEQWINHYQQQYFQGDENAYDFPLPVIDDKINNSDAETFRQACAALAGHVMRSEVYANDRDTHLADNPYSVSQSNVEIKLIQEKGGHEFAVFQVLPAESIEFHYERNPEDPRVAQHFVLETDKYGNILQSCAVSLPRRSASDSRVTVYPEQQRLAVLADKTSYVSPVSSLRGNRDTFCHMPWEHKQYEVSGIALKDGSCYFTREELRQPIKNALQNEIPHESSFSEGRQEARLLSWNKTLFWDGKQDGALAQGNIAIRALVHHQKHAVFTQDFIKDTYEGKLADEFITNEGGYHLDEKHNYWWARGLVQHYYKNQKQFYLLQAEENAWFSPSSALYRHSAVEHDAYYLAVVKSAITVDKPSSIISESGADIDYITMHPCQLIDPNKNVSQAIFDPLGQVIVSSEFGVQTNDGGKPEHVGGMRLYPLIGGKVEYQSKSDPTLEKVIADSETYLQGAATYFYYDLHAWRDRKQPACSVSLVRDNYYHAPSGSPNEFACKTSIDFVDGLGRKLQSKIKTTAGDAWIFDNNGNLIKDKDGKPVQQQTEERYIVSGRTVYNNKGKACEQYLPYFTNRYQFEYQQQLDQVLPPPTTILYDPPGRVIKTISPKKLFSKVEFTPWEEKHYDENDTVPDSEYYQDFMNDYPDNPTDEQKKELEGEKDALEKAAQCYNTPSIHVLDNLGHVFLTVENSLGNVTEKVFKKTFNNLKPKIVKIKPAEVYEALVNNKYLKKSVKEIAGEEITYYSVSKKFEPYDAAFTWELPDKFKGCLETITDVLQKSCLTTYTETDILGRTIESIDPRLYAANQRQGENYYNFRYRYAMADKHPVITDSVDGGTTLNLNNVFGQQLWTLSPRGYCQYIGYDQLGRKSELRVKKLTVETQQKQQAQKGQEQQKNPFTEYEKFNQVEVFTYGEAQENAVDKNLWGQLYAIKDLPGIVTHHRYSLHGELLQTSRQMVADYKSPANWKNEVTLEQEIHTTQYTYNALKHLLTETSPDSSVVTNSYDQAGLLYKVSTKLADGTTQNIIDHIHYDAKGQREGIKYGNGIVTKYFYEDTTLRLQSMTSKRSNDSKTVQDITYWYDPEGNITRTCDKTHDTVFYKNQQVEPVADYSYDTLYRLIEASGRQHKGITADNYKNTRDSFKQSLYGPTPSPNDAKALENYTETYTYDDSGNLIKKQHEADSGKWTKETPVEDYCNQLKDMKYDASGNMRSLPGKNIALDFNCCENLVRTGMIIRPLLVDDCDYYLYDSEEQRTRKLSEHMAHGQKASLIEEKIYLGNFEIKRKYKQKGDDPYFERNTLRVMADGHCVAIIHTIVKDNKIKDASSTSHSIRFQMDNHQGSVSLEMNEQANLISYEEYFPYGGTALITGKNEAEVKLKEYRYSGKERDDSTGLYYYGYRYYAPWLGRWLNPDPAGTVDGLNVYAFVGGNPVSHWDEEGLMFYSRSVANKKPHYIRRISTQRRPIHAVIGAEREDCLNIPHNVNKDSPFGRGLEIKNNSTTIFVSGGNNEPFDGKFYYNNEEIKDLKHFKKITNNNSNPKIVAGYLDIRQKKEVNKFIDAAKNVTGEDYEGAIAVNLTVDHNKPDISKKLIEENELVKSGPLTTVYHKKHPFFNEENMRNDFPNYNIKVKKDFGKLFKNEIWDATNESVHKGKSQKMDTSSMYGYRLTQRTEQDANK